MNYLNPTPQYLYHQLKKLPEYQLATVWQFLQFLTYQNQQPSLTSTSVKLGGLWREYQLDFTEADIHQARQELWGNLGEVNE